MDVKTVIKNIDNTIHGKEMLREKLYSISQQSTDPDTIKMMTAVVDFIDVNLTELRAIKRDLEMCAGRD